MKYILLVITAVLSMNSFAEDNVKKEKVNLTKEQKDILMIEREEIFEELELTPQQKEAMQKNMERRIAERKKRKELRKEMLEKKKKSKK